MPETFAVWKYTLGIGRNTVEMPANAVVLHCHEQNDEVCIWVHVHPYAKTKSREFHVIGTGHATVSNSLRQYVGTAHIQSAGLVWHVFEILSKE